VSKVGPGNKAESVQEVKEADAAAAELQTLTLDAVAPLVHILEEAQKDTLTVQSAAEAAKSALVLLVPKYYLHTTSYRQERQLQPLQ